MSHIKSVTIPKPCHQAWQAMAPVSNGRYCQSCCKTVTDFTAMSNDEIIMYLSSNMNVCGRINDRQLNNVNAALSLDSRPFFRKWSLVALVIGLLSFVDNEVKAQDRPAQYITSLRLMPILSTPNHELYKITGDIRNNEGEVIPGANILVYGTGAKAVTKNDGSFAIDIPASGDTLMVSFIGYVSQKISVNPHSGNINITLAEDNLCIHSVTTVVGGLQVIRRPILWRIWYHIKKSFRSIF
ncbi:MAG: carboxypeptidase-like regulatory domain-containing protein [Mucilaginibacter sp.]